jgi:hypothetical protein
VYLQAPVSSVGSSRMAAVAAAERGSGPAGM